MVYLLILFIIIVPVGYLLFREIQPHFDDSYKPVGSDPDGPVRHLWHLHGKDINEVIGELGPPNQVATITLRDPIVSWRLELSLYYPRNRLGNLFVQFQEYFWQDQQHTTAIWFHRVDGKWVVLTTLQIDAGYTF